MYPLPALLTHPPFIPFNIEENTGGTNEVAKGTNKAPRNPPFCISCFTVSLTPSINTHESSNYFMILIISYISSFKINKVNPFPALTARFPFIFFKFIYCIWI